MVTPFTITQGWMAFLFILTAVSAIMASMQSIRVVEYHLPIPLTAAVLSTLTPVFNLLTQPAGLLCLRSYGEDYKRNAVKLLNVSLQTIVFTVDVLATLAASKLSPQGCQLADQWKQMFSQKSEDINSIQKAFQCCGFMTTKDRAYPFPGKNTPVTACMETYGFTRPCAPLLETANYHAALTFFLVLLAAIVTKIGFVYIVSRFEILKALFPEIVEDIFDVHHDENEHTGLLSGRKHFRIGNGTGSTRSEGSLLADNVDN